MPESSEKRQQSDRRSQDRRQPECVARAGYRERLRLGAPLEECSELCKHLIPPSMCAGCPGVLVERRVQARRSGEDRRER